MGGSYMNLEKLREATGLNIERVTPMPSFDRSFMPPEPPPPPPPPPQDPWG
jgi:hypothetical protein